MANIKEGYLSKDIFRIIRDAASEMGVRVFVVGGYVRDCFLGRANDHIEIVVEGDGIELGRRVGDITKARVSYFRNFGTAKLKFRGTDISIAGARRESFRKGDRKPILEEGSLQDDQLRRDFTINAMAFSLNPEDYGALIDPFGGIRDVSQGIIRTPLDPGESFQHDPLRMIRAIRFSAQLSSSTLAFRIEKECLDAIWRYADRVESVAKERVVEELNKTLLCDVPSKGFMLLEELGILKRIIPALSRTKGVEKIDGVGHEDSFPHSLAVVDNIAKMEIELSSDSMNSLGVKQGNPNLWLRWAALLHEIGKPSSKRFVRGKGWTFYGYDVVGAKMVPNVFSSLKMTLNEGMKYVQKLISLQNRPKTLLEKDASESAYRRLLFDAGEDIMDLMLLCKANVTTINKAKASKEYSDIERVRQLLLEVKAKEAVRNFKNPISANYIMEVYDIEPCNTLGELKDIIKDAILSGEIENTFEAADALLRKKAAEKGLKLRQNLPVLQNHDVNVRPDSDSDDSSSPSRESLVVEQNVTAQTEEKGTPGSGIATEAVQENMLHQQEEVQIALKASEVARPRADLSEIIRAFNENGISRFFFITSEEEFNAIRNDKALVKPCFYLYTHDFSKEIRGRSLIALEVDLHILTLPGALITFEKCLSRGQIMALEVADVQTTIQGDEMEILPPNMGNGQKVLSSCVIIVRNRIPISHIINFDAICSEYSSPLPF